MSRPHVNNSNNRVFCLHSNLISSQTQNTNKICHFTDENLNRPLIMNPIHLHTITQMTVKTLFTTCTPFYSENGSKPFKSNLSTKETHQP